MFAFTNYVRQLQIMLGSLCILVEPMLNMLKITTFHSVKTVFSSAQLCLTYNCITWNMWYWPIIVCTDPQSPQPMLIQKERIQSESNDSPDITSLKYEPEESSEDFYVDMGKHECVCVLCMCVCVDNYYTML